ncbi:MAG: glycosyltransferase [Thermodesulfovibrionales bacterium]
MDIPVLIPAYNPDDSLLSLADRLIGRGFKDIVIVNDGSDRSCGDLFEKLEMTGHCHVLHHAVNLGKGRALKTGFNHICINFKGAKGVITVDADGQHLPEDAAKVAETFLANPDRLVIGARKFSRGTPLRSLIGNTITRYVFRLLIGKKLSDTQSGLRCIPLSMLPDLIRLEAERYEYEMNMLILAKANHTDIVEEQITTVYLDDNRSSHFNPLTDSMRIYFLLLRFFLSSVFASTVDFIVFASTYLFNNNILMSLVLARLVSGGLNFAMNKRLVFQSRQGTLLPLVKYFILFISLAGLSYVSIRTMSDLGINVIVAKIVAETVLFIASFTIQRDFVFASRQRDEVS